ncbi:SDR family NAD(P)-dependent oxidoreductase [Nonomuraea angiospora]|uniref:SDR family NAD(P)-dependent oxidoreductase n=1 Tax=Nonomuraea angiospora TaxID=46172 RepID=UPI00344B1736
MPVIAIVGAGPGLGIEIARAFGAKGFTVAMIARNAAKLDALASDLHAEGIQAAR